MKTAHAGFPKQYLLNLMKDMPGGVSMTLQATVDGISLTAMGYKYNSGKVLFFIATEGAGSSAAGHPYVATFPDRLGNKCTREVYRPALIGTYFDSSPKVRFSLR